MFDQLTGFFKQSESMLALGVILILALLFVPLPPMALDFFFAVNITISVVILMTVLFLQKALEFSSFPMLLLITTMFRLALNVASTRLVLENGHSGGAAAGHIIEAFGAFVMGGEFIIGFIIFMILVIINFIVITKGSGRIAEVAARFTLDSLPGKQMAIDADLNAGLINETQAKERRKELEQETGFYGAMDGASKFVRGDAIAGLIITAINIIAGIAIGMLRHDMSFSGAAENYIILSVGDGLVAQIPALIISTAAGILIAKSGTNQAAGTAVLGQLQHSMRPLLISSALLFFIGMLPDMPMIPFWFLGTVLGGLAYLMMSQKQQEKVQQELHEAAVKEKEGSKDEPMSSILHVDTLRLELGYGLLNLIDEAKGGKLTEQIKAMRRQMAKEIGFVVPSIRIQDNMQLEPGGYNVVIKDVQAGQGMLKPGMLLAMDPTGAAPSIAGEETVEPTFGLPARWIEERNREEASFNGYTVVDCSTVITTHLTEVIKDNLADLLTRTETQKLLDEMTGEHKKLVTELVPSQISMASLQKVLQNLLSERISIRDLPTILEAMADAIAVSRNIITITEMVRARLSRQISAMYANAENSIPVVALSSAWEKEFSESIRANGEDRQLAMDPAKVQAFLKTLRDVFEKQMMAGLQPVLMTSSNIRPFVRTLTERPLPSIPIVSQAEIHTKVKIKTVATV